MVLCVVKLLVPADEVTVLADVGESVYTLLRSRRDNG